MTTLDSNRFEERLGRSIAARLSEATFNLPNDISERLKAARMQALSKRKVIHLQLVSGMQVNGGHSASLHAPNDTQGFWGRMAALIPLIVLVVGLLAVSFFQEQQRAHELAAVDVELLADDLPPAAYTDAGFLHYLRANRGD